MIVYIPGINVIQAGSSKLCRGLTITSIIAPSYGFCLKRHFVQVFGCCRRNIDSTGLRIDLFRWSP